MAVAVSAIGNGSKSTYLTSETLAHRTDRTQYKMQTHERTNRKMDEEREDEEEKKCAPNGRRWRKSNHE